MKVTIEWKYSGAIFDAHTHIGHEGLSNMIDIEEKFGIRKQIGIIHTPEALEKAKSKYPEKFVFAKYLPTSETIRYNVSKLLDEIANLSQEGFSLVKMWFGPRWRDYVEHANNHFRLDNMKLDPFFNKIEQDQIPLIIHVGDPDTYFQTVYSDASVYGTKKENLIQLENVLTRHPTLKLQIAHFGSQPEIHRLENLSSWMKRFPNIVLDTASSRWMARELSKNVDAARSFIIEYSDRILFGTDVGTNRGKRDYYEGRYVAQRLLWETDVRDEPLPFIDKDTEDSGGTFINGLDLPLEVLENIYWNNAHRFYDI
ncbi:MAG: amidohydrolase family protein [Candidatus Lokiarchaeota archaeon]|nr:amidohydrolase family protein [Candidatus Lokiarchaeota archaeon]